MSRVEHDNHSVLARGDMAVDPTDVVLFGSDEGPTIVARCRHNAEAKSFVVESIALGKDGHPPTIAFVGPPIAIPDALINESNRLRPAGDLATDALKSAYAALSARLVDLEIDRTAPVFGLPATVRYTAMASIVLPPFGQQSGAAGFHARCHVELATPAGLRGRFGVTIDYSAKLPTLSGTFGWPSIGLNFVELDFSDFSLIARAFSLAGADGWLPKTRIVWDNAPPTLTLTIAGGLSLAIDASGAAASGKVELDGTQILNIDAFRVAGPIDDLAVTADLSYRGGTNLPPGSLPVGPLTITWRDATLTATADAGALTVTTHIGRLGITDADKVEQIAVSLDLVTRYPAGGDVTTTVDRLLLIEPKGEQLAALALREIGGLKRIALALPIPDVEPIGVVLDRMGKLAKSLIVWLGAGLDAVGGALIGLGKGAAAFADWIFNRLREVGAGASLLIELRWDATNGVLKQIVISRAGAGIAAQSFDLGELKIGLPAASQPILILDIVDHWFAIALTPQAGGAQVEFSTDLWVGGATGTTAVRGSDAAPLIKATATLAPPAGDPAPVALVLLQNGRPRFLQSLGGGPAETIAGGISVGSPLVPGSIPSGLDVDVVIDKDRLTAIFPSGTGSASKDSTAPKVTVKDWKVTKTEGSVKHIEIALEVLVGSSKSGPISATVTGQFDLRSFELRFEALEIPINAPDPIEFFGAKATFVPNSEKHAFVLRIDEAASIALATGARAELRFTGIGDGSDVLTFDAEGPKGLALGASGLDLDAKVRQNPIRLPGLDTPFRFTGGAIRVERGRFLAAGITGSGALPPALLGEAKIEAGIQFARADDTGSLVVESATARLERAGEPLVCESTRFHFELTHVGLGFKLIDSKVQFYGELTGSATFRPNSGEFASGLLSRLPEIRIDFERAPIAGDGRALAKAIHFQIPINPPARAKLFDLFEFELRGIGFHPAYDGWSDTPPTLSLSGQARMTESFDIVQTSIEAHQLYITRPEPGGTLPRIRMDGLGVGLRIAAMGEFSAAAIAVDGSLPSLFKPEVLPANVTANGFLASGRLMIKGWAAMSGSAGFLELAPKDASARIGKRLSFYVYAQQEQLSEPIPTPVGTLYLREVGFGFGFRYTLAALAQTDQLTDPRDIIRTLDPLSQSQGDLSSFPAWQPELEGDRLTLALRALFSVTTASSGSVYNAEREKDLDNPVLFDVVAALRSDLTFLLSARAWLAVNYADWLTGPKDWHEKPILRGYIYVSAPKRIFLGRLIVDPKGHVGEHPKLPEPLVKALSYVKSATATIYITPDLFHQELGWPYELQLALGDRDGNFHVDLSGGMVLRIEDGAVLHGLAFRADGHVRVGGRGGGSVGASAQALATFALDGKFIAFISVARPVDSIFYGRLGLALCLDFSIEFWVDTKFFSLSASWSEKIDVEIDLELAVGPRGIGGHARASLSLRRFGRGLRLGVSLGFNEDMLGAARGRVERFMTLGLGTTVPDPATGLPPLPESARRGRADKGDDQLVDLARRRESQPLPDPAIPPDPGPPSAGDAITDCEFWAIVMPIRGRNEEALLHLVPRDHDAEDAFFGAHPHGDYFVAPDTPSEDGLTRLAGHYILSELPSAVTPVLGELQVLAGQIRGMPDWKAPIDQSGGTVAELVGAGFLAQVDKRFTQPKLAPADGKEALDTLGCIEARGALIGHVAEQARLLADDWRDTPDPSAGLDPRLFGLTYKIGGGGRSFATVLAKLFPPTGDPTRPRAAAFQIAKSDVAGTPLPCIVELLNPVERWFSNAQPRLADPRVYMRDQTIKLAWDLEPTWGASQGRYDDPEYHLMHYAIQRHIMVERDQSRPHQATWLAKRADTIDLIDGLRPRDHQVIDRLDNLPEALRKALILQLSENSDDVDVTDPEAHAAGCKAWIEAFGALELQDGDGSTKRASVELVYSITAIDNSGTRGDPSPPIRLQVSAPLSPREEPFRQISLSFDYLPGDSGTFDFPRDATDRPTRLTIAIGKIDPLPSATIIADDPKVAPTLPPIELYFDITKDARSGIFGADLLDTNRHRDRVVPPAKTATALLHPGVGARDTIAVQLFVIDPEQSDPTAQPEPISYHLSTADFDLLVASPRHASQIYARWQPAVGVRPAAWTRCDLKMHIARKPSETKRVKLPGDDFLAPIAEFEQPVLTPQLLLPESDLIAEQGVLYRSTPAADAVLGATGLDAMITRDPKDRRGIRLSWQARPHHYCDGSPASPDRIGGFDLFVASRDREPDTALSAEARARLAQPLGRILVKPKALLNSEPAQIEDFSKLEVAYPSASSIAKGRGWYSAAESRLVWPKPALRRSLMLVPDEGLIGELFADGRPVDLKIRFETIAATPEALKLALAADDQAEAPAANVALADAVDGWQNVTFTGPVTPSAVRELLQRLVWIPEKDPQPLRAQLRLAHAASEHVVEVALGGDLHPILTDLLDLLRYDKGDFVAAKGYRRYEPVLEGAPSPAANVADAPKDAVQKPAFAQLLSDTAEGSDKAGWAALRQLGLAVGFRLWDTETSDWVDPADHRKTLTWAWREAITRYPADPGEIGAPFLEQFYDPEELFVLGGEDMLRRPRRKDLEGMPLLQASLRPIADRLIVRKADQQPTLSVHYLHMTLENARLRAADIDTAFAHWDNEKTPHAYVQLLLPATTGEPGASVWVGSVLANADGFVPDADYLSDTTKREVIARIVLEGDPLQSERVAGLLRSAIAGASDAGATHVIRAIDWSPADATDPPFANPYLLFEPLPPALAALIETPERTPGDGRARLKSLAARRFTLAEQPGPAEALALQRWEKRFFALGRGVRLPVQPDVAVAFATMDAPASLRRAPDDRGRISILYLDEGQLGSWRRFYVRPFGRYDHLAQASGWLGAIEGRLDAKDFGAAPPVSRRPWVDVALARSREVRKPVLLASAYAPEANALVLVAARSDQDVLAGANVPQAGAAQIGGVDIGFHCTLDEPRLAWATAHLGAFTMPELDADALDPLDDVELERWLLARATPPRPAGPARAARAAPELPIPDLWRGATAVAAYDFPYFFSYTAQLSNSAGTANSPPSDAALPSPLPVDARFADLPTWRRDADEVIIRLPLARFADCMDDNSHRTWYKPGSASAPLFELPDPAIVYRIYLRSPLGDMWSSEIDVEAQPKDKEYAALVTGQTFTDAVCDPPIQDPGSKTWSFDLRVKSRIFDDATAKALCVVPVRQTQAMQSIDIGEAP